MINSIDFYTPLKYLIYYIGGLFFLSIAIRVVVTNVTEIYFRQKEKHLIKTNKGEVINGKD